MINDHDGGSLAEVLLGNVRQWLCYYVCCDYSYKLHIPMDKLKRFSQVAGLGMNFSLKILLTLV